MIGLFLELSTDNWEVLASSNQAEAMKVITTIPQLFHILNC